MKTPLSSDNISSFIRSWVADEIKNWKDFDDMLNQGFCADLADAIWHQFDCSKSLAFRNCDDPVHTWIEFEGKHYDMQNPEGVADWKQLTYFKETPNGSNAVLSPN